MHPPFTWLYYYFHREHYFTELDATQHTTYYNDAMLWSIIIFFFFYYYTSTSVPFLSLLLDSLLIRSMHTIIQTAQIYNRAYNSSFFCCSKVHVLFVIWQFICNDSKVLWSFNNDYGWPHSDMQFTFQTPHWTKINKYRFRFMHFEMTKKKPSLCYTKNPRVL